MIAPKITVTALLFVAICLLEYAAYCRFGDSHDIVLRGTASGGKLYLVQVQQMCPRFVSVDTTNGESTETVLRKLTAKINASDPFGWLGGGVGSVSRPLGRDYEIQAVGSNTIAGVPRVRLAFTGTDKGFAIPKPVLSVSGYYDPETTNIVLWWINPTDSYDSINMDRNLPLNATSKVINLAGRNVEDALTSWYGVFVVRGGMMSPPANIRPRINAQEELDAFPFYMGVAPNWSAWSDTTHAESVILEQGTKPEVAPGGCTEVPDEKPFYQIIKTTRTGVQGGTYRRFLGLRPSRTYKVEVRLNTLLMDSITNDWAFSFHAAHDYRDGTGLSPAQLAGTAALPDGSKGPAAGRVALYGPGVTTKGKWVKRSTSEPGPGLEIKDLTLPPGVTSITVWLRHSGANSTGVGMDWIRLEDVTSSTRHSPGS
jgi:hypothetical protein